VEIAEQDGGFRAGDDEYDEDQEQKTKHIIRLL